MKLAVFVDQVFWFDGERYSTDESFIKFVTAFEPYFEKIVLCGRVAEERKTEKYVLNPARTEVCALPFYQDIYTLWKGGPSVTLSTFSILAREVEGWDLVWLCVPHPLALPFIYFCRRKKKPFFMFVRENLVEQMKHRNRGPRKVAGVAVASLLDKWVQALARDHVTFTVGREMYQRFKRDGRPVFEAAVPLISKKDIELSLARRKQGRDEARQATLLSVGRLDPEKGLEYLIEAMQILVEEHGCRHQFVLHLVGSGPEEQPLRRQVHRLGLERYVHFHGYVTHGQELFERYRTASVFILHSFTEGIPQVLLEAMACGTPVVATKVGGIPYLITDHHDGLLVEPARPRQISEAVLRIIGDEILRGQLIENAFQTVLHYTLEAERDRVLTILRQFQLLPPQGDKEQ